LDYVIPTEYAFGDQYTYVTGSSNSLVNYYSDLAARLVKKYDLQPGDAVVEIGSNDGTLLKAFQSHGLEVLGIEGAAKSAALALEAGVPTLVQFFGKGTERLVRNTLPNEAKIRLIFAMNVLAHTDNINDFLPEVGALMEPDTVFVSQSHWLVELVRKFEFDTIYHEHLRYYTVGSLMRLFETHGLSMADVEINDFYGGSILCYAAKGPSAQSNGLRSVLKQEEELDVVQSLKDMKRVLLSNRARLCNLLVDLKESGNRIVGIGAPMKASTLLNFYGITPDLVEYIAEVNPLKVGTVVPGVRIPVVHEEVLFRDQPDYALLLTWNMAKDIVPKLRSLGYQGKFIIPVPELEVIE
jgi:SAM-dependent methyltransferase